MIEFKNVSCSYGKKNILQNISFEIKKDISILGANGSGKSTLAKAICALVEYNGEILVNTLEIKKLSYKQRAKLISYIPPKLDLYEGGISVCEFTLMSRFAYKKDFIHYLDNDKQKVQKSLKQLGIVHLKDAPINSLSSGETQLMLMAGAIAQQSKIIILDEPTSNLDPKNSKIIAREIKKLKENHQVILITHDLHLAKYVNSDIAFIQNKKVKLFGKEFFQSKNLASLYGVEFENMAVKYA